MRTHLALTLAIPLTLILAGCVDTPEDVQTASASDPLATATAATTTPFTAEGNTYNGAFACAVVTCYGATLPTAASGTAWFEVDLQDTLTAAELTLTWTATNPANENLVLGIYYENDGEPDWIYASGTSPLTLSETKLNIPAKNIQAIYVNGYKCQGGGPAALCAGAEQPFTIEGTLTTTATTQDNATTQP